MFHSFLCSGANTRAGASSLLPLPPPRCDPSVNMTAINGDLSTTCLLKVEESAWRTLNIVLHRASIKYSRPCLSVYRQVNALHICSLSRPVVFCCCMHAPRHNPKCHTAAAQYAQTRHKTPWWSPNCETFSLSSLFCTMSAVLDHICPKGHWNCHEITHCPGYHV